MTASTVLTVIDRLPELPEGRTIAVTEAAAEELGMLGTGLADVVVSVVREGSIERKASTNTGWYSFDLGLYSPESAYTLYEKLEENNLRPYAYKENEGVRIKVRHVLAFRLDQAISTLQALGIKDIQAEMEPNPYLS